MQGDGFKLGAVSMTMAPLLYPALFDLVAFNYNYCTILKFRLGRARSTPALSATQIRELPFHWQTP